VKLAEAAALSDDPWYSQRLDSLTDDLAARTREVLGIAAGAKRDEPSSHALRLFDHAAALFAWARRDPARFYEPSGLA
jgi:hypothetical protein